MTQRFKVSVAMKIIEQKKSTSINFFKSRISAELFIARISNGELIFRRNAFGGIDDRCEKKAKSSFERKRESIENSRIIKYTR